MKIKFITILILVGILVFPISIKATSIESNVPWFLTSWQFEDKDLADGVSVTLDHGSGENDIAIYYQNESTIPLYVVGKSVFSKGYGDVSGLDPDLFPFYKVENSQAFAGILEDKEIAPGTVRQVFTWQPIEYGEHGLMILTPDANHSLQFDDNQTYQQRFSFGRPDDVIAPDPQSFTTTVFYNGELISLRGEGYSSFDLWGVDPQELSEGEKEHGFSTFKTKLGGELVSYENSFVIIYNNFAYNAFKIGNNLRWVLLKIKKLISK